KNIQTHTLQLMGWDSKKSPFTSSNLASVKEVEHFAVTGTGGPTTEDFCVDLKVSLSSAWNKRAAVVFRKDFIESGSYNTTDSNDIEATFLIHLKSLRTQMEQLDKGDDGNDGECDSGGEDMSRRPNKSANARQQHRYGLSVRRTNVAKAFKDLEHFLPFLRRLTFEAHSGDESEVDGYGIIGIPWRAPGLTRFFCIIDRCHISTHFKSNGRPTQGAFPRFRFPTCRVEADAEVIKGLPANCYNSVWLETLDEDEIDALNMQPVIDLKHTPAILQ
ncbi:uncharacterized protein F5147DRAFT_589384, partial [Suillus discolor]